MRQSPGRAEAGDPAAWLPVPDVATLAPIPERAHAGNRPGGRPRPVRARIPHGHARPSPARAHPHDADAWFPLPVLAEPAPRSVPEAAPTPETRTQPAAAAAKPSPATTRASRRARIRRTTRRRRARLGAIALLAVATAVAVAGLAPRPAAPDPEVTLAVDGQRVSVSTEAETVGDLLAERKIDIAPDDEIRPVPETPVRDGLAIRVVHAFGVHVDHDGTVTTVRTTRPTATALRRQLDLDPELVGIKSAPQRLGESAGVVFRTRHTVTVTVDGTTLPETTMALTVAELLVENQVVLGFFDQVTPAPETRLADAMTVAVARITGDEVSVDEPYTVPGERVQDPALPKGQERVVSEGAPGVLRVTYQRMLRDGLETGREAISKIPVHPAAPRVVAVGSALPKQAVGTASPHKNVGTATYYASPYGPDSCATKEHIPKGTILRVTNLDTGAVATCRVADRVEANRVVDLDDDVFVQLAPKSQGVFNARIDW